MHVMVALMEARQVMSLSVKLLLVVLASMDTSPSRAVGCAGTGAAWQIGPQYRGTSLIRTPPPHRTLQQPYHARTMVILGGRVFLMSEVPLYVNLVGVLRRCSDR